MVSALCFAVLFLGPRYRSEYATLRGWKPDLKLLLRLLRFGGPNGVNFMLDIMAFTFFLFIVGPLGADPTGGDEFGLSHQQPRLYAAHWLRHCRLDDGWPALGARSARSR